MQLHCLKTGDFSQIVTVSVYIIVIYSLFYDKYYSES